MNKKLGYYSVGNLDFDSKIQACIFANQHDQKVEWRFNEDYFKSYDWTIEPNSSLDQLYDRRARQLRESYDYIIISYSGGADSHNIVESFIRQNLHIDELVINTMEKGNARFTDINLNNKKANNAGAEHYLQTLPRVKELSSRIPKTKITILDMTDQLFSTWRKDTDGSWVTKKRESLHPLNVTRFNYLHFSEVRKQFDKDKSIAVILGIEKPRTFIYEENKFYLRFVDKAANVISISDHFEDYSNSTIEYFYWSPEGADIVCKQAHVLKRWLEKTPEQQKFWYWKNISPEVLKLHHERLLRSILYSTWDDSWYQADKAVKDWYSEFDEWFIKGYQGTVEHSAWLEGIKYVQTYAKEYLNYTDDQADGLTVFGHNYYIGKINNGIF